MNEKQKLAVVRPDEIAVMRTQDDLAHPYVDIQTDGTGRADAEELRLWRATRQSEANGK
jgi:hypothetical protein